MVNDPLLVATAIFVQHIIRVENGFSSACDRESLVVDLTSSFNKQQCIRKGNIFRLTAAKYRYNYQEFLNPFLDAAQKFGFFLPTIMAPYFFAFVLLGMLNIYVIYRVAKESCGVVYHLAQATGDVFALVSGLICLSDVYIIFAPLFAFWSICQQIPFALFMGSATFWIQFSLLSMVLLWHDRYMCICFPFEYFSSISAKKHKKKIFFAAALALITTSVHCLFVFAITDKGLDLMKFLIVKLINDFVQLVFSFFSICIIGFFCLKTATKAKHYQPPEGTSNYVESAELMKRFYRLTVQVLILNSAIIFILFLATFCNFFNSFCIFAFSSDSKQKIKICAFFDQIGSYYYLTNWTPFLSVFSSNIGLIVHSVFSEAYRKEVIKIFHGLISWFRCKYNASVAPFNK